MKLGQSACMFRISHGFRYPQNWRYIAELNRFAEGFHPPIYFSLLIQAILVYSTSR